MLTVLSAKNSGMTLEDEKWKVISTKTVNYFVLFIAQIATEAATLLDIKNMIIIGT